MITKIQNYTTIPRKINNAIPIYLEGGLKQPKEDILKDVNYLSLTINCTTSLILAFCNQTENMTELSK